MREIIRDLSALFIMMDRTTVCKRELLSACHFVPRLRLPECLFSMMLRRSRPIRQLTGESGSGTALDLLCVLDNQPFHFFCRTAYLSRSKYAVFSALHRFKWSFVCYDEVRIFATMCRMNFKHQLYSYLMKLHLLCEEMNTFRYSDRQKSRRGNFKNREKWKTKWGHR